MKKYIHSFQDFLVEQDMSGAPLPGASQPALPKKEKPFTFIFIDDSERDQLKRKKYPDGSIEVTFPSFSLTQSEIDEWAKENIVATKENKLTDSVAALRRKNLSDIVSGAKVNISKEDIPFIEKLRTSLTTDLFGRKEPDITVIFAKDGVPTTDDVDVTFVKYKK